MKKIKRVLILTREFKCSAYPKVGGTGIFYKNLSSELVKRGISVNVFLISKKNFDIEEEGVKIHSIKDIFKANPFLELLRSFTGRFSFLKSWHFNLYKLEKEIISKRIKNWSQKNNYHFDVAETHDFEGMALSIPTQIPYAIRCHGSWNVLKTYFGYKNVSKGRIYCEKLAFNISKNIITISQYNEKINKNLFQIQNPKLIYNGVDEKFYAPIQNTTLLPKSIFFLGNVSYEKGADTLLNSFIKIKERYPEATLHFIGNPNHYPATISQNIRSSDIENSITFYGNKSSQEIVELINKAEVVCFPSKGENFSLSLLEVMAIQKPVICSEIDSFKEIIKDSVNGLIANEDNFHEKISLLFEDNNLKNTISFNARTLIETEFCIDKMVTKTIDYYKEII